MDYNNQNGNGRYAWQSGEGGQPGYTPPATPPAVGGPYTPQGYGGPYYSQPPATTPSAQPEAAPPAPQKAAGNGRNWLLLAVSMLLVALLAGFGGGYLATLRMGGGGGSVVYRSPENGAEGRSTGVESMSVAEIAALVKESVVSITTENLVNNPFAGGEVQSGAGSGVIISQDGYIITNNHVVEGADKVIVTLNDGTDVEARVIGTDATSDVAVVKIEATGLVPAVLGDANAVLVGDFVLAVGNPMGTLGGTVTDGIISALDREVTIEGNTMTLLQTSAAVSPGNSGGGLFNANGELVGVVNAKSSGENSEGLGFAIPINEAMAVAEDLITLGYVSGRPAMGVTVQFIATAEQALQMGVSDLGVYVADVAADSAAEAAGIQPGDFILEFDGQEVDSTTALTSAIRRCSVGDTVQVVISRGGQRQTLSITLQEMQAG